MIRDLRPIGFLGDPCPTCGAMQVIPSGEGFHCTACRASWGAGEGDEAEAPIQLAEARNAPNPGVVRMLEKLLEDAQSGRIRVLACCGVLVGGDTFTAHDTVEGGRFEVIGALEVLQMRLALPEPFGDDP